MLKRIKIFFISEWLFFISLIGFLTTSLFLKRFPVYTEEDFKVVFTLLIFFVLIKGLEITNFLRFLAVKIERGSFVSLKLVIFTGLISMFVTNDVALMIVVPLTLAMNIPNIEKTIIFEAIAANGGSAVSPFGNPQNIFIYFHYHLHFLEFIKEIFPLFVVVFIFLILLTPKVRQKIYVKEKVKIEKDSYLLLTFLYFLSLLY